MTVNYLVLICACMTERLPHLHFSFILTHGPTASVLLTLLLIAISCIYCPSFLLKIGLDIFGDGNLLSFNGQFAIFVGIIVDPRLHIGEED